jgi:hypothetical protein
MIPLQVRMDPVPVDVLRPLTVTLATRRADEST